MKVKTASKTILRSATLKSHTASPSKKVRSRALKEYPSSKNYHPVSLSSVPHSKMGNTPKRNNSIEFHLIFSVAFGLFLLTSVLERALPHKWSSRNDAGEIRKSVVEQAKDAAHISVGYAFMG